MTNEHGHSAYVPVQAYTVKDREIDVLKEKCEKQADRISVLDQSLKTLENISKEYEKAKAEIIDLKANSIRIDELEKENKKLRDDLKTMEKPPPPPKKNNIQKQKWDEKWGI